jgi:hypothetical protein
MTKLRPITGPVVIALFLGGCHSACFQTARIRSGVDAAIGVTHVRGADHPDVSEYSILVRGEVGWAAHRDRAGYSLGLTFISPVSSFETESGDIIGIDEPDYGSFPNQWAGAMPEFKLQLPRRFPVDAALDLRFNAIYPERIGALVSRPVSDRVTPYAAYFLNSDLGQLGIVGADIGLTKSVSLMAEYTLWLSEHDYPDNYHGGGRRNPYSFGLGLSYHLPRASQPYDPRPYARNCDVPGRERGTPPVALRTRGNPRTRINASSSREVWTP